MVKTGMILAALSIPTSLPAQELSTLSLQQALSLAEQHYPLVRQNELNRQTDLLSVQNLNTAYLPQLSLNGQATYQSEVTKIDIPFPGIKIPTISKDQYRAVAEADQLLYDGGLTRRQKEVQLASGTVQQSQVAVELYALKSRINQLYFAIVYEDALVQQNELVIKDIQAGIDKVRPQVENGVSLRSNLQLLQVQLLQARQHTEEIRATRKGLLDALAVLLNQPLNETVSIEVPALTLPTDSSINRPELQLYNSQSLLINQQQQLVSARNAPKLQAFIQGGYGRPGLNLLSNEFRPFYIGGVRLNWNIGSLYNARRDKQLLDISRQTVGVQKDVFLLNTQSQLKQQKADIEKYAALMITDGEIIELRHQITETSKAQLENRVITANDYLTQVNAEDQARQSLILHRIQYMQALVTYAITSGKL